jgi:hypothetical protein
LVAADEDTVRDVIHTFNAKGLAALDPRWAGGRLRLISDGDIEVIVTADRIEYVTSAYPDRCFAFDQFGPLSIRPCHGVCWAPRKRPVRLRATYHRALAAQRRERARIRSERRQRWGRPKPKAA